MHWELQGYSSMYYVIGCSFVQPPLGPRAPTQRWWWQDGDSYSASFKRLWTATKTAKGNQLRTRTCQKPQRHWVYFSASTVAEGDSKPWRSKSRDVRRASWLEHWLLDIFSQLPHSEELSKQREAGHFTWAEVTSLHLHRSHLMLSLLQLNGWQTRINLDDPGICCNRCLWLLPSPSY